MQVNTNIVLGVHNGERYIASWRISSEGNKTSDEYGIQVMQLFNLSDIDPKNITGVIVSSVVPNIMHSLENMLRKCFCHEPIIVGPGVKTGINIKYDNPREVGADRIVNAVAAYEIYKRPVYNNRLWNSYNFLCSKSKWRLSWRVHMFLELEFRQMLYLKEQLSFLE